DLDVLDLLWIHRVGIVGEYNKVRKFSRRDRTLDTLFTRCICTVDRVHAKGVVYRDSLVCAPSLTVPTLPRDHSLYAHQRCERSRTEVRTGCRVDAGIEQRSISHGTLHRFFAIEHELV